MYMFSVSKQNVHMFNCIPERSTLGFKGFDHVANVVHIRVNFVILLFISRSFSNLYHLY